MKNLQNSNQGFSIVLAMGITIVISLIAILILEFIIPFTNNVKSVENGSAAYYFAYSGIEESLWDLSQNSIGYGSGSVFSTASTGSKFDLISMTSTIPPAGKGNTEYDDKNWNRFDPNIPIQLQLNTTAINFNTATFQFRVPDMNRNGNLTDDGSFPSNNEPIINWIISGMDSIGQPVVLNGKDHASNANYIRKNQITGSGISIGTLEGLTLDDSTCRINAFYGNTCPSVGSGVVSNPTLKLSIIDELLLSGGQKIPYIEYKINFGTPVPGRYSQIETEGKSYGYKKTMDIKVPQLSTNQAFDFAVFQ